MSEAAHALIDGDGRLVEADELILGLNARAGGDLGRPVAVPQLATLSRIVRRLGIPVSRGVSVANNGGELELFVRAAPADDGVHLSVAGWREIGTPPVRSMPVEAGPPDADWRWETDATLRLSSVSLLAGRIHGFDGTALLGRALSELFRFVPDIGGDIPILDALAERRSFAGQPARIRGSDEPVLLSAVARRDRENQFAGFAGGVVVGGRSAQPATQSPFLAEQLERVLRLPLGQIIANADSINAAAEGPLLPDYAAYAADIASAGRHLLALVDDLADLEAVERPDLELAVETIDLADIARRAAGLLSVRAANAGVTVLRPEPAESLPARGDFRRTLQILVNLIGNAIRYSPRGATVGVAVKRKPSGARVSVTDSGVGIAPEDQARIFEKFERVDPSEPGGNGLGLYISRRLARAMGGDVIVKSTPGQGARFALTLPA